MKKYGQLLSGEVLDLTEEIKLLSPTDTPLYTMLANRGQVVKANDVNVSWRQKTLNTTRGNLVLEGAESGAVLLSQRGTKTNVCQILEKATAVTGTVRALNPKGVGDEFVSEVNDRLTELKRDIEWYIINGTYTLESGSTPRQMNGLLNLIENAQAMPTGANERNMNEDDILNILQSMWTYGAQGEYYLFANATEKRIINNILKNAKNTFVDVQNGNNELGILVNRIVSDFGNVNIVLNRHMPNGTVMAVDMGLVELAELRAPFYEDLAKTGDYSKGHVLAENTVKLLNTRGGAKITGITK